MIKRLIVSMDDSAAYDLLAPEIEKSLKSLSYLELRVIKTCLSASKKLIDREIENVMTVPMPADSEYLGDLDS